MAASVLLELKPEEAVKLGIILAAMVRRFDDMPEPDARLLHELMVQLAQACRLDGIAPQTIRSLTEAVHG